MGPRGVRYRPTPSESRDGGTVTYRPWKRNKTQISTRRIIHNKSHSKFSYRFLESGHLYFGPKCPLFESFRSTICLLKLYKEFFLLKTFLPKYIRKPRYMEVKIHARIRLSPPIVKFVLGWPKLADFVAIGPKSFF